MFDLRYHVASLAAVFFALVIGILVGVALASHGLGNSERLNYQRQIQTAQNEIDRLNGRLTTLEESAKAGTSFLTNAYGAVMTDRLRGRKIAVLSIGPVDQTLHTAVTKAVGDAGGTILRLRAITLPLSLDRIDRTLRRRRRLALFTGKPKDLGRELAAELVTGGDTPLWNALEQELVEELTGTGRQPADGVVVLRSAGLQHDGSSAFVTGLLKELASRPTAVAVEATAAAPSFVSVYERLGMSSVDDMDTAAGRIALAVVLSGVAPAGSHYGTRAGDAEVLPPVPVQTVTAPAGG